MNLYLIRHARQASKLCNVNVELAQEGVAQAKLLAKRLADYPLDAIYSSDLIRAVATAQEINQFHQLDHVVDNRLEEIDFGALTGNTDAYNAEHFADFYTEYKRMEHDIAYPEGESGTQVYERVMPALMEIIHSGAQEVAVVTHGGVIRAVLAGILGLDQSKRPLFAPVLENTGITQLSFDESTQRFYLQRVNDCAHLEGQEGLMRGCWK